MDDKAPIAVEVAPVAADNVCPRKTGTSFTISSTLSPLHAVFIRWFYFHTIHILTRMEREEQSKNG